ncbi:MAG: hypothetical protein Q8P22_00825 [Chloroflexota bacterium]|nr:hypothetical protein [Chloroflexota bacterium]
MALRRAGEEIGIQEVLEALVYEPYAQDSGDLEAATKTITATAKPGTPDYTASLTVPGVPDARLVVLRLCLRLQITMDSFNAGATTLNYAVHVNGAERLTGSWAATGAQYAAVDLTSGQFNLGSANSIEVFLWVNAGNAVVSVAQVWQGVGSTNTTSYAPAAVLQINHQGLYALSATINRFGTGTPFISLTRAGDARYPYASTSGAAARLTLPSFVSNNNVIAIAGTVGTDLNFLHQIQINLRRLQ